MLNVSKAWQYSTGNGVPWRSSTPGVNPNPRLPVVPGGDYIMGGDGLTDCDAHGTIVASLIGPHRKAARRRRRCRPRPPSRRRPVRRRSSARTAAGRGTAPATARRRPRR